MSRVPRADVTGPDIVEMAVRAAVEILVESVEDVLDELDLHQMATRAVDAVLMDIRIGRTPH